MCLRLFSAVTLVAALVAWAAPLAAQDEPISIGVRTKIHSEILNEDLEILIATPANYAANNIRYPVICLLDGNAYFLQTVASARFLAGRGMAPGMIVVGIPNTDRARDLTPPSSAASDIKDNPTSGGADLFRQFLVRELRPFIDARYRTEHYHILIGWSFGGLFAVHALLDEPDSFDAYVAISPSLWWNSEAEAAKADTMFTPDTKLPKFLYLTHGREYNKIPKAVQAFTTILGRKAPEDLRWAFSYLPNDNHASGPARAIYDALELLFEGWAIPEEGMPSVAGLEEQYGRLTEQLGFVCRPDEARINGIAYAALQRKQVEESIALFQYAARLYPDSPNVYDSLADGLEAAGQLNLALENCRKACRLGEEQADRNLETFRKHLESVTEKLEGSGRALDRQ